MYSDPITDGVAPSFLAMIAIAGGVFVAVIFFFMLFLSMILRGRQREQTTRELAAYVAEGSLTAEDAERIQRGSRPAHEIREIARATRAKPCRS
ncbi:MAG: hypothetical protein ACIAQU_06835 [Phycisphaerales bacterium JB064]